MSKSDRLREMQIRINELESEIVELKRQLTEVKKQPMTIGSIIKRNEDDTKN